MHSTITLLRYVTARKQHALVVDQPTHPVLAKPVVLKYVNLPLHHSYGYRVVLPPNRKLAAGKCQTYAAQPREANVYSPFLPKFPLDGVATSWAS